MGVLISERLISFLHFDTLETHCLATMDWEGAISGHMTADIQDAGPHNTHWHKNRLISTTNIMDKGPRFDGKHS